MKEKFLLLLVFLVVNPYTAIAQGEDDIDSSGDSDKPVCGRYWPPDEPQFDIKEAKVGDFPWHVGMVVFKNPWAGSEGRWFCAGTIIDELWVLTTALCLENATKAELYPGAIHLFNNSIFEVYYAYEFHIHVNYTVLNRADNIGLIKLHRPLFMDDPEPPIVSTIKLVNYDLELYTSVKTPGWGALNNKDYYAYSNKSLMYASSLVAFEKYCQNFYQVNILEKEFCAVVEKGNVEEDRGCFATFGAAAIDCYNETAVGIFAFVGGSDRGPCGNNFPMGYVKIYSYLDWIKNTTGLLLG